MYGESLLTARVVVISDTILIFFGDFPREERGANTEPTGLGMERW